MHEFFVESAKQYCFNSKYLNQHSFEIIWELIIIIFLKIIF